MSTITSRTSIAGANLTVTVKVGNGMLPLNQKILARLDQRNVAAHPWHDLEIGLVWRSGGRLLSFPNLGVHGVERRYICDELTVCEVVLK
ncbi:hypothetical protein M758_1G232300 [Ceratodon purpureus]|nr:hypothetical protein M758_1G232300 [Ceratodon purpureus]